MPGNDSLPSTAVTDGDPTEICPLQFQKRLKLIPPRAMRSPVTSNVSAAIASRDVSAGEGSASSILHLMNSCSARSRSKFRTRN